MLLAQHEHIPITFAATLGPDWVRAAVLAGALLVVATAFVRPFVVIGPTAQLIVSAAAGGSVLLMLLLAKSLDMPRQGVVLVLAGAAMPLFAARQTPGTTATLGRLAPWVMGLAGTVAAVEMLRAALGDGDQAAALRLGYTGVGIGLLGLSWLLLCRPGTAADRSDRRSVLTRATDVGGWLLGNVVLASVTMVIGIR